MDNPKKLRAIKKALRASRMSRKKLQNKIDNSLENCEVDYPIIDYLISDSLFYVNEDGSESKGKIILRIPEKTIFDNLDEERLLLEFQFNDNSISGVPSAILDEVKIVNGCEIVMERFAICVADLYELRDVLNQILVDDEN